MPPDLGPDLRLPGNISLESDAQRGDPNDHHRSRLGHPSLRRDIRASEPPSRCPPPGRRPTHRSARPEGAAPAARELFPLGNRLLARSVPRAGCGQARAPLPGIRAPSPRWPALYLPSPTPSSHKGLVRRGAAGTPTYPTPCPRKVSGAGFHLGHTTLEFGEASATNSLVAAVLTACVVKRILGLPGSRRALGWAVRGMAEGRGLP